MTALAVALFLLAVAAVTAAGWWFLGHDPGDRARPFREPPEIHHEEYPPAPVAESRGRAGSPAATGPHQIPWEREHADDMPEAAPCHGRESDKGLPAESDWSRLPPPPAPVAEEVMPTDPLRTSLHAVPEPDMSARVTGWPGQPGKNTSDRAGLAGRETLAIAHVATLPPEVHYDEYAPAQRYHPALPQRAGAEAWQAEVLSVFPASEPFTDWLDDTFTSSMTAVIP